MTFELKTMTAEIPKGSGREGLFRALEQILKLPRVERFSVDSKGVLTVELHLAAHEEVSPDVMLDFSGLHVSDIVRNCSTVVEATFEVAETPWATLAFLLHEAHQDRLYPIAFATGAGTTVWKWLETVPGPRARQRDVLLGYPLLIDRHLPDDALLLCAGATHKAALVDTRTVYRFLIPRMETPK